MWGLPRLKCGALPQSCGDRALLGAAHNGQRQLARGPLERVEEVVEAAERSLAGGRLLGINAVRMDGGLLLALPADATLRKVADALGRGDAPARPRLGLALAPPRAARRMRAAVGLPERDGLLVRGVEPGSPAEVAGLQPGDLLVAAGEAPLGGFDDLFDALERAAGELPLTVVRGTEERAVTARLG